MTALRRRIAAEALVAYGLFTLAGAAVAVQVESGAATAPSWSLVHLVVALALAIALARGSRWARWGAIAFAVAALLVIAPVAFALVGGGGGVLELVPPVELILVALQATVLVSLVALLVGVDRA